MNMPVKVGIWLFMFKESAQGYSKNNPKRTLITKAIEISKTVYKETLINKLLPIMKEKWTVGIKTIIIQQDNAKSHLIDF